MPKLTDIQSILLSSATQRPDDSLLPVPETLTATSDAVTKAIAVLMKQGMATEVPTASATRAWRADGNERFGAVINDAGRTAIGVEPEDAGLTQNQTDAAAPPAAGIDRATKSALVLSLLRREQGATLAELVEATGWLPHTARAALTNFRKKGHAVIRGKRDKVTYYALAC